MKIIVNINKERGIGCDGELLVNIPEDMKYFRKTTSGGVVIMGRKTLLSFPGQKPLKGRINIVLTSDPSRIDSESRDGADLCLGEAEALREAERLKNIYLSNLDKAAKGAKASEMETVLIFAGTREAALKEAYMISGGDDGMGDSHVFVIGGASIYDLFLDCCDTCLITENDADYKADRFFPDLKADGGWELAEKGETKEHEGIHYSFDIYKRRGSD